MAKILFDASHNERVDIHGQYSNIRLLLQENGFKTEKYDEFPIKANAISDCQVVVFGSVDGSKFFAHEIRELIDYASEGGSILILSHSGGDSGMGTNMNELLRDSGINIERNQVQDEVNCWSGIPSHIEIERFASKPAHPIIIGVRKICYISGCELIVDRPAIGLAFSEGVANPPNACLMAISKYRAGRLGVVGSHRMFSNSKAGIGLYDNSYLFTRLIRWLAGFDDDSITSPVKIPKKMGRTIYFKSSPPKMPIRRDIRLSRRAVIKLSNPDDEGDQLVRPSQIAQWQDSQPEEVTKVSQRIYSGYRRAFESPTLQRGSIETYQPSREPSFVQKETVESYQPVDEASTFQESVTNTLNKLVEDIQRIDATMNSMNEQLNYIRLTLSKIVENQRE
ncbi:MAG: hypothetical protein ACFFCQ_17420 [Promethearchaeota archaeon]